MRTLLAVFVIWHISMIRKNKTDFRAAHKTNGSLSAVLKVKLDNPNLFHTLNQSRSLIEKSKTTSVILIITRIQHYQTQYYMLLMCKWLLEQYGLISMTTKCMNFVLLSFSRSLMVNYYGECLYRQSVDMDMPYMYNNIPQRDRKIPVRFN